VMEAYKTRTDASQIQCKGSAMVWKFDEVDPEFGLMQAQELRDHLQGVLSHCQVVVSMGKGYVEVRPKGVNKGAIVDHIVSQLYTHSGGVDFILCIGDDSADEFMFQALNSRFGEGPSPSLFTAVVGRKPSAAKYYLNDPDEVLELCQSLRLHSTRANRNRSTSDLQRLSTKPIIRSGTALSTAARGSLINPAAALPTGSSANGSSANGPSAPPRAPIRGSSMPMVFAPLDRSLPPPDPSPEPSVTASPLPHSRSLSGVWH